MTRCKLSGKSKICLVIGDPIEHSLSPLMHNSAYEELGLAGDFVFAAAQVAPADLPAAMAGMRALRLAGLAVTAPHKTAVLAELDEVDPLARKLGAVNTVVCQEGRLLGFNTDIQGVTGPILRVAEIAGKRAAVIGAGGAARAAVYALLSQGAEVVIFNRSAERARELAAEAGCRWRPLQGIQEAAECDIIFNATTVGLSSNVAEKATETLVPVEVMGPRHLVFDAVYRPHETRLLREARAAGAKVIYGVEMLAAQGAAQFQLFTGRKAPLEFMEQVLKRAALETMAESKSDD